MSGDGVNYEVVLRNHLHLGQDVVGEGREKVVTVAGERGDKVWVQYSRDGENKDALVAGPEFFKAQFYLHKILHELLPDNFPDYLLTGQGGLLVERIPADEDAKRANDIMQLVRQRRLETGSGYCESDEHEWLTQKHNAIYYSDEYQTLARVLEYIGVAEVGDRDRDAYELAVPVNTYIVDGHPVIIETMDPLVKTKSERGTEGRDLLLNIDRLGEVVDEGVVVGKVTEEAARKIRKYAQRYKVNANSAIESWMVARNSLETLTEL
ncbi:MAG: hypothetical protein WCV93_01420 [Candidatus Shapirobacteria bacterium]|jgi:hypothetical protein